MLCQSVRWCYIDLLCVSVQSVVSYLEQCVDVTASERSFFLKYPKVRVIVMGAALCWLLHLACLSLPAFKEAPSLPLWLSEEYFI